MLRPKDVARFWAGVDRSGDCWVWTKARDQHGYGRIGIAGQVERAHRVGWEVAFGPIPPGKHVLHKCDNPPCVRPTHLFVGTNADNVRDRTAKRRSFHPHGSLDGNAKLDEAIVILMRDDYAAGRANIPQLAEFYGVSVGLVGAIITGRLWKHVGGSVRKGYAGGERHGMSKLSEMQVRDITSRRTAGEKLRPLAAEYGVSEATISLVARGKTWRAMR